MTKKKAKAPAKKAPAKKPAKKAANSSHRKQRGRTAPNRALKDGGAK